MERKRLRIVFMGTPGFAVSTLEALIKNNFHVVAIVTAPDRPAGRGQKITEPAVKVYAKKQGLKILQPVNLKDPSFVHELEGLTPDLQIVVAFRMLPGVVWNMPLYGTINLHASLLPQYRGAAPINWAIINGDKETGVTTFFLRHEIDTGNIIFQEKVRIEDDDTAGTLHDKLMLTGARLVVKTVNAITKNRYTSIEQSSVLGDGRTLKHAPKIFKNDCRIDWDKTIEDIYNFIRGLSPYPSAWTEMQTPEGIVMSLKIFEAGKIFQAHSHPLKTVVSDGKTYLWVALKEGYISINYLQLAGKNKLPVDEFLRGLKDNFRFRMI